MKRWMSRIWVVIVLFFIASALSSCGIIKKDVLYEYTGQQNQSVTGNTLAVIESYEPVFTGNILAYNYWKDIAVFTTPSSEGYGLYSYQADTQRSVSASANRFVSASASENGEVYFTERDASNTEYVYKADSLGEKRVLMAKAEAGKSVVWCVSEAATFVYLDRFNRLTKVSEGKESVVCEIPDIYGVSKIRYCEDDGIVMMLAKPHNTDTDNLYRIDVKTSSVIAIDVYVTAMSVVTSADKTAYLKTDSQGQKQLYVYDHNTLMREYIISGNIDRITLSPYGGYVAYSLRPQEGGGGSVWIVNTRNFTNVQITANTNLSGEIFWSSTERGLIFTHSETNTSTEQLETVYRTYRLRFNYEYTEE